MDRPEIPCLRGIRLRSMQKRNSYYPGGSYLMVMKTYEETVAFHGHSCGGLALGYKAAEYAVKLLDLSFSPDEEVVCIAETDSCAVDAVQAVLGCTAGKGNLIIHKWGKMAFSFYRRDTGASVRLLKRPDAQDDEVKELRGKVFSGRASAEEVKEYRAVMDVRIKSLLKTPPEEIFLVKEAEELLPAPAMVYDDVICSVCGETAAEGLCRKVNGKYVCPSCARKL